MLRCLKRYKLPLCKGGGTIFSFGGQRQKMPVKQVYAYCDGLCNTFKELRVASTMIFFSFRVMLIFFSQKIMHKSLKRNTRYT